jgi:putative spermidine/putrescine transport system permease protein
MATYTLTHVEKKPLSFAIPVIAAAGAFAGLFVGTAQGSGLMGVVGGAVLLAVLGFIALGVLGKDMEKPFRWALVALMAAGGYFIGGLPGLVVGTFFGWFYGFFIYWIGQGRYRANLVPYLTGGQVLWHYTFRIICGLIFFFLITPIVVVMPLSFNAEDFFTFTPEMLRFDPEGYSLKHYRDFFTSDDWQQALRNSVLIAPVATLLSVTFGTLAAIGLSSEHVPFRRPIMAILISPMIVPLIISAAGMYFFYSRLGCKARIGAWSLRMPRWAFPSSSSP